MLRFSANYLDGELGQGAFTDWMLLKLAAVLLLVTAGTLMHLVGPG
jgi:NAD(P)H-quinone oxidoreductase subunit 5